MKNLLIVSITALIVCTGCRGAQPTDARVSEPTPRVMQGHATTVAIDEIEQQFAALPLDETGQMRLIAQRWPAVQRAVAYHGTTHRDAFYGSRAYWHTGSTRGIGWAIDQPGNLDDPAYLATKGNVRIQGNANADIEIAGNAIIHILGDLDATLDLQGICEVIVAGRLTERATIICDGQLELFVAGDCDGILGSTASSTIIIDGNARGTLQSGAPATKLTITGDLVGEIPPPKNKDAVLTLRVDGYLPTAKMLDLATAGFTRINATLGVSDAPPGLYPQSETATRPTARWVVLEQRNQGN